MEPSLASGQNEAPAIPESFLDLMDAFLAFVELEKGQSRNTASGYENDLRQAAAFFYHSRKVGNWLVVRSEDALAWIGEMNRRAYSVTTQARKLSALRAMARFLVKENHRPDDFTELVASPKIVRPLPGCLSIEEVDHLLDAPSRESPQGLRDRAFLELFYSSGLRVSELCDLLLTDIDLESYFVRVRKGKGAKERVVPIGEKAREALQRYLHHGRPHLVKSKTGSALFLSARGQSISRKTIWHWIKQYAARAGISHPVKPHLLRHSFATHLLAGGADLRVIQEMLGHADIATTEIYTRVDESRKVAEHERYHPRKGM